MNGLSINALTDTQSEIISMIDKVTDPLLKSKILQFCLEQTKNSPSSFEKPNITKHYSMKEVLQRLEGKPETSLKPSTSQDLRSEVNIVKSEIKLIREELDNQNIRLIQLESLAEKHQSKDKSIAILNTEPSSILDNNLIFLNTMQKITYQKWYISINIVINKEYTIINVVALVDSRAEIKC